MRRHGDDADVAAAFLLARPDRRGGLESTHLRHLNVHQHQIERLARQCIEGLASVVDDGDRVAASRKESLRDPLIDDVVLGHQNGDETRRRG